MSSPASIGIDNFVLTTKPMLDNRMIKKYLHLRIPKQESLAILSLIMGTKTAKSVCATTQYLEATFSLLLPLCFQKTKKRLSRACAQLVTL